MDRVNLNIELPKTMSIEDEATALEAALQRVGKDVILVNDGDFTISWSNGRLLRHRPWAGRSWTCRKITSRQLIKIAPYKRLLQVLQE